MTIHQRSAKTDAENDIMRCVADDSAQLVFASPALGWALGYSAAALTGKPVKDVVEIVSALDGRQQGCDFKTLQSGFYEVALLRHERDPLLTKARIDRVDNPNGRAFTVIWIDPDGKLQHREADDVSKDARDFAVFIDDSFKAASAIAPHAPAAGHIHTADSELRHFLNITSDILGVYRRDMSFVRVNPAFNRVLGYSDAELKTFPFINIIHPEDREKSLLTMQKVLRAPGSQETRIGFTCRALCRDGSLRTVEWILKSTGDYLYIVGHDVTAIRAHEEELRRREEQLSEAQKIGRMGHWYWPVGGESMEWSDQIFTIFGVSKDSFPSDIAHAGRLVLKRDLRRLQRSFQRALLRKRDYEIEFRVRRPGGTVRYVRCEGRCKLNPKTGAVEALFGIMQDITERTLHEKALRAAKETAENAYASKTRFLANMSHELRTPLNAIIGFSEMIQRQLLGPVGNARYLDYIGGIRESGEHLLDIINDILDMSKIEVGKYELYLEDLNISKIIRLAVHMIESKAHDAQVRLVTDDVADDIQLRADRRALMQVLLNLLSNAVKFTHAGGTVEVRCQRENGRIAISVSDTGIGIPKDKIDVVTLPFEQVDSEMTRSHEGTGLGLAITKDLIELHSGTLDIESEVDVGTTVTVMLPENLYSPQLMRATPDEAADAEKILDRAV
jgi:two-component system, cell cycle sensor histidine kinase PleC